VTGAAAAPGQGAGAQPSGSASSAGRGASAGSSASSSPNSPSGSGADLRQLRGLSARSAYQRNPTPHPVAHACPQGARAAPVHPRGQRAAGVRRRHVAAARPRPALALLAGWRPGGALGALARRGRGLRGRQRDCAWGPRLWRAILRDQACRARPGRVVHGRGHGERERLVERRARGAAWRLRGARRRRALSGKEAAILALPINRLRRMRSGGRLPARKIAKAVVKLAKAIVAAACVGSLAAAAGAGRGAGRRGGPQRVGRKRQGRRLGAGRRGGQRAGRAPVRRAAQRALAGRGRLARAARPQALRLCLAHAAADPDRIRGRLDRPVDGHHLRRAPGPCGRPPEAARVYPPVPRRCAAHLRLYVDAVALAIPRGVPLCV